MRLVSKLPFATQLEHLNPEQKAAVLHAEGPAMVLAGAGSGKTRVLTTRAAWLLDQGLHPSQLMLVTFTNKAAGEIRTRVTELTGSNLPWSGTFHSLCARILRIHGHLVGLPAGFSIYDTDDQVSLVKQIYKQHGFSTKEFKPKSVLFTISDAKNEMIGWQEYQNTAYGRFQDHVAKVYKLYQHALDENDAVDFDDLLLKVIELFETTDVLAHYQDRLKHILVDEYQDTNKAQYVLTKMLSAPQNNLFVVGDFAQSIYAWRGADYRNMLALKTEFDQMKEYRLEQNYRSTQNILEAATQVVSHNTSHPVLSLWTDRQSQIENQPLVIHETNSQSHEAETVVSYIRQLSTSYQYKDMAILYRTNAQSRAFEEAFVRAGIPYQVVGGTKFYERKEIKDVLSYLRLLANPNDTVSHTRAEKIGKRRLQAFQTWKENLKVSAEELQQLEPGPALEQLLKATTYLKKYDEKDPDDLSRLENIRELINVAYQFQNVLQLLENIALVQNETLLDASPDDQPNQVTLMSLHAAKGLEFPVVFMVGMEDGLLPHSRSLLDQHQMEEERRLCYVGITRAKDQLYFTYAKQRTSYQGTSYSMRSRFLGDIQSKLVTKKGGGGSTGFTPAATPTGRRVVPVDDETLDGVLSGDFDVEAFLDL